MAYAMSREDHPSQCCAQPVFVPALHILLFYEGKTYMFFVVFLSEITESGYRNECSFYIRMFYW